MQRARRRKLRREAARNPFFLQAVRGRDHLRHVAYQGINRERRRAIAAGAVDPLQRNPLAEAFRQIKAALR